MSVAVENVGLVAADDVRLGLATWRVPGDPTERLVTTPSEDRELRDLPGSLQPNLELVPPPTYRVMPIPRLTWVPTLVSLWGEAVPADDRIPLQLGAFDRVERRFRRFGVAVYPDVYNAPADPELADSADSRHARGRVLFGAAVYVIARNMPPDWYQLRLEYEPKMMSKDGIAGLNLVAHQLARVPHAERPVVALQFGATERA